PHGYRPGRAGRSLRLVRPLAEERPLTTMNALHSLRRTALLLSPWLVAMALLGCHAAPPAAASLRDDYHAFLFANRKLAPLNPTVIRERKLGETHIEEVRITTEEGEQAVVLIQRPLKEKKYPAVLLQHFLGGTKDDQMIGLLMGMFAGRGYLVAA